MSEWDELAAESKIIRELSKGAKYVSIPDSVFAVVQLLKIVDVQEKEIAELRAELERYKQMVRDCARTKRG